MSSSLKHQEWDLIDALRGHMRLSWLCQRKQVEASAYSPTLYKDWNNGGDPPKQIELPPTSQEIKFNHDANCLEDETRLFAALSFDQIEEDVSLFVGPDVCAHHHLHTVDE